MFQTSFRAFRPRHPLMRLLTGALGILVALLLLALGAFALAALVVGGALFVLVNAFRSTRAARPQPGRASTTPPDVIEGEFTVVEGVRTTEPASTKR
jgi:hypothetical protein